MRKSQDISGGNFIAYLVFTHQYLFEIEGDGIIRPRQCYSQRIDMENIWTLYSTLSDMFPGKLEQTLSNWIWSTREEIFYKQIEHPN